MKGNVALLLGPEEGLKQEWIDKEKKELEKKYPDLETYLFFTFESDGSDVASALQGSSLFSSHSLVLLKHFDQIKKTSPLFKELVNYLKNPNEDSHLFIISDQGPSSVPSEISKLINKDDQIVFWEMFENKKRDYLRSLFRSEGFQIAEDAIDLILELVENNTRELKAWCTQLVIFFHKDESKRVITEDDVSQYLTHTRNEDAFSLFNAVAECNLARSIGILNRILNEDPRSGIGIISILQRQFRLLESFNLIKDREGLDAAFEKATALSTSAVGPAIKGIKNKKDRELFTLASKRYTAQDCSSIISYLEEVDITIRQASGESEQTLLELVIHTIINGKGKRSPIKLERELMDNSFRNIDRY